jgi:hypothetical protein
MTTRCIRATIDTWLHQPVRTEANAPEDGQVGEQHDDRNVQPVVLVVEVILQEALDCCRHAVGLQTQNKCIHTFMSVLCVSDTVHPFKYGLPARAHLDEQIRVLSELAGHETCSRRKVCTSYTVCGEALSQPLVIMTHHILQKVPVCGG